MKMSLAGTPKRNNLRLALRYCTKLTLQKNKKDYENGIKDDNIKHSIIVIQVLIKEVLLLAT